MAFQLDAKFFRRAKKVNRAVEITDNHAIIPAVRDAPEIRVSLPNRRLKTMEERQATLDARLADITALEEQIEVERKKLMSLTNTFRDTKTGGAEVVVQNMKVSHLMSQRNSIKVQTQWIEEIAGLTFKDIFESARDVRKIGADLFQVKRRGEPIETLYVDLAKAAADEEVAQEATLLGSLVPKKTKAKTAAPTMAAAVAAPVPTAPLAMASPQAQADVRQGAIVAQTKKVFKLKASGAPP